MATGEVDILNRVFRLTIRMSCRQVKFQTSFHLRDVLVPNQTPQDAHAVAKLWMNATFRPAVSTEIQFDRLEAEEIRTKDYFAEDFVATTGGLSLFQQSTFLAASVALKSENRARYANNRMFWPAAGPALSDQIAAGQLNLLNVAAADMMTRWGGLVIIGDFKLVAVGAGTPAGGGAPAGPKRWTDVTSARVNPNITSLRSRKQGVGN